jgi:lipase
LRLHLHEWGSADAPPLVCLHGVTSHGARFAPLAERLPRFRVLAPDLRGHGRSGWEPPWRLGTHVDDVLETAAAAGVDSAAWVGHSFGGRVLIELAARFPERVERVVLLDPAIRIPPGNALRAADSVREERIFATPDDAVAVPLAGPTRLNPPELVAEEREQHLEAVEGGYRWRYSRSAAVAILGELAVAPPGADLLRAPVLLVVSEEVSVVAPRQIDELRRVLGERLRVARVAGGHNVLWDAFEATAAAVSAFLDDA